MQENTKMYAKDNNHFQENTKIYTNGEIHFTNQITIPIKYALVNNKAVLIETSEYTYKLDLKPLMDQDINETNSFARPVYYLSYKWNDEFKTWDPSNIEYVRCEE